MAIHLAGLFLFAGVILVALPLPKDVQAAQPSTASILNAPETAPPLSTAALSALLAVNVSSAFFPTDLTVKCDGPLRGTHHTVRCIGGYPVGGYVLEPPFPPDRAMLFLHGLSDVPTLHLTVLATLLGGDDAAAWQTARVLLPLAPVLPRLFRAPDAALRLPAGAVHAWFDISHTLPYQAVGALAGTTPAAVAASLVATGVVGDRLGLAASTRRLCAMALVQAAGDLGGGLPPGPCTAPCSSGTASAPPWRGTRPWRRAPRGRGCSRWRAIFR